jgi:hypothetical protein
MTCEEDGDRPPRLRDRAQIDRPPSRPSTNAHSEPDRKSPQKSLLFAYKVVFSVNLCGFHPASGIKILRSLCCCIPVERGDGKNHTGICYRPKISLLPRPQSPSSLTCKFITVVPEIYSVLRSNRIQEKHLCKSRHRGTHREICTKIYSEMYPEKIILDIMSRVIGVVWCVRSENAKFC